MKLRFLPLLALLVPAIASAQTLITYTVTAQNSNYGYVQGQQYTFTFETAASFSTGDFSENDNIWRGSVLVSISGTGINGTLAIPEGDSTNSYFDVSQNNYFQAQVADITPGSIGLTTPNGTALSGIQAWVGPSSTDPYVFSTTAADINSQLAALIGSAFTNTNSGDPVVLFGASGSTIETFTSDSVTFSSASAIPEPAQAATIAGCLALIAVFLYRRRRNSAPART